MAPMRAGISVRRVTIAATGVLALMGLSVAFWVRAEEFRRLAEVHADRAKDYRSAVARKLSLKVGDPKRLAEYHAALATKYDRAARCPFLPVAPDPPEFE